MGSYDKIFEIAKQNNGIITLKDARRNNIGSESLSYLVRINKLTKSDIGIYTIQNYFNDEYFNIQYRCQKGIFSHISSLYLLGLTDINPNSISITFPHGYNFMHLKNDNVICHTVKKELYDDGIIDVIDNYGNNVKCYCAERTLCDILNPRYNIDIRVITDAFKKYVSNNRIDLNKLGYYAKKLRVENKVRNYLEVLL